MASRSRAHGEVLQVAGFFALFAVLALLEMRFARRGETTMRPARWRTNLGLTGVNLVVLMALPVTFVDAAHWA